MEDTSQEQKNLIKEYSGGKIKSGFELANFFNNLYMFFENKYENEPVDKELIDIWLNSKKYLDELPKGIRISQESISSLESRLKNSAILDELNNIKISNGTSVVFLLGAGASARSGIPTVNSLLGELWKQTQKMGRDDLDELANWCNERGIINIEDLLTAAYISNFAAKNRNVNSLLRYFLIREDQFPQKAFRNPQVDASSIGFLQDTLQTLFGLLASTMISAKPNPTHEEIVKFIKQHPMSSIITTNYDGCMDEAILNAGMKPMTHIEETFFIKVDDAGKTPVDLIKMHGSINWAYCDSCQEVKEFDLLFLKDAYKDDKLSYPVMGLCKNCGGLSRPLLVPPLSFKILMFPKLIDLWDSAKEKIEHADYLIVIGYSFAEADTYITKIIARSMSRKKEQKVIVVDTNPDLVATLRKRFESQIYGFEVERIIRVCESSDSAMGNLLKKLIASKESEEN